MVWRWTKSLGGNEADRPMLPWAIQQISMGRDFGCAVSESGEVSCWGDNRYGQLELPEIAAIAVEAGGDHACLLMESGEASCWGFDVVGQTEVEPGAYVKLAAGSDHTCGLSEAGDVSCWGWNEFGQSSAPVEAFVEIAAGAYHTCGVLQSGGLQCWGSDEYGESMARKSFEALGWAGAQLWGNRRGSLAVLGKGRDGADHTSNRSLRARVRSRWAGRRGFYPRRIGEADLCRVGST